jgi:myo-inositol-1(or 4)-monophosphatase
VLRDLGAVAREAVERAGVVVRGSTPGALADKGDRDPQSETDLLTERAVREFLARETPEIPVFGEEEGGVPPGPGQHWIIDPIDGTVNYIHGLPLCAVSLCLLQDRSAACAATHLPFLNTTYTAYSGGGACLNGRRVRVSTTVSLRDALVSMDQSTFTGADAIGANATRLGLLRLLAPRTQRLRILGASAIDLAWTAEGKLDACIIAANHPWDTSGGVLLAREAGAVVVDLQGRPHSYDSTSTVAVTPGLAAELLSVLGEAEADEGRL